MNYKRYSALFSMSFFVSLGFSQERNTPKKPIKVLAIDYHGVIVKVRWDKLAWCSSKIVGYNISDLPEMVKSGFCISKKAVAGEELSLESVLRDVPHLKKYEDDINECMNALEEPNEKTIVILKRLKQQGVKLVLASNMHENSFEINKSKLKPELFKLFDFYHIAGEKNGRKPDSVYYKNLRRRIEKKLCNNENECVNKIETLFTDDLSENIEGAEKADIGIQGIHFTKAEKLEEDLIGRGFMKKERNDNEK